MNYKEKSDSYFGVNGDNELKSSLRNLAVGATPVLLDFLTGKTAQMKTRGFQKANEFTKALGNEKAVEVDIDGEPVLVPEGEAMFRKKWNPNEYKEKTVQQERLLSGNTYRNLDTDEIREGRITSHGIIDANTLEPFEEGRWVKNVLPDIRSFNDIFGGYTKHTTDRLKDKSKTDQISPGEGNLWGNIPKGEVDFAKKQANEAKKSLEKIHENILGTDRSIEILSKSENITPASAAAAYQFIAKALNKERMTDEDYDRLIGRENRSYYSAAEDWASRKFTGKPSQEAMRGLILTAKALKEDLLRQAQAVQDVRTPDFGKNKKAKKKYKDIATDIVEEAKKPSISETDKINAMIKALGNIK